MSLVAIAPGAASEPHIHRGYETAIFVLEGEVETHYGARLERVSRHTAGDFVYVPADLPHQAVNPSPSEWARAIVARNDADEREKAELYDPVSAGTP